MSNPIKITMSPDGEATVGVPGRSDAPASPEPQSATPAPQHKTGGIVTRYSTATGVMETVGPSGARVEPRPTPSGITVRSAAGLPTSLGEAESTAVVTIPGLGQTSIAAAVTLGYLQTRAGGRGYEIVPGVLDAAVKPTGDEKPAEAAKKDELPAGDVTGVEPTSSSTDATLKAIQTKTPMGLEGIVTSLSKTGELPDALVEDMARQHGTDPVEFRKQVDGVVQDHVRAAQQAIRNVDPSIDPIQFQAWLLKNPELANTVTRDVMNKNVASVQDAARVYSKNRSAALVTALEAKGYETWEDHGSIFIRNLPGAGKENISVREAIERGLLEVTG